MSGEGGRRGAGGGEKAPERVPVRKRRRARVPGANSSESACNPLAKISRRDARSLGFGDGSDGARCDGRDEGAGSSAAVNARASSRVPLRVVVVAVFVRVRALGAELRPIRGFVAGPVTRERRRRGWRANFRAGDLGGEPRGEEVARVGHVVHVEAGHRGRSTCARSGGSRAGSGRRQGGFGRRTLLRKSRAVEVVARNKCRRTKRAGRDASERVERFRRGKSRRARAHAARGSTRGGSPRAEGSRAGLRPGRGPGGGAPRIEMRRCAARKTFA